MTIAADFVKHVACGGDRISRLAEFLGGIVLLLPMFRLVFNPRLIGFLWRRPLKLAVPLAFGTSGGTEAAGGRRGHGGGRVRVEWSWWSGATAPQA